MKLKEPGRNWCRGASLAALLVLGAATAAAAQTAERKSPPSGPSGPPAAGEPDKRPPLHARSADTPRQRAKLLQDLYAHLAAAEDAEDAGKYAEAIERLWLSSGSDAVSVLMNRAAKAAEEKNYDLSITMLDSVVTLAPDYAEGFNRRAYVNYMRDDFGAAMADLRRALALDPNHFKALDGLAQILKETGDRKNAYAVYKRLAEVHPFWQSATQAIRELGREIDGQAL